jgi:CHAT domain-containing protein/Tfp pilus assembly protein PilF
VRRWAALAALLLSTACSRPKPPLPAETFASIRSTFLRGDLVRAHQQASAAYPRFAVSDPAWAWKFRLLDADVLVCQGLSPDLLKLLEDAPPAPLDQGDLNVRRHMFRAIAFSRLGQAQQADEEMREAERLCDPSRCEVTGEIVRAAGAIALDRNDVDGAQQLFRKSLEIARNKDDRFLEATALLNLGWVALGSEHYDESIDWTNLAYSAAQTLDARQIMEKASGNRAWAYYKMGDFERALSLVTDAEKSAEQLGFVIDEIEWLNNHGLIYFQLNQFPQAEEYFRKSLALVQTTQNRTQIVDALNSLSYVLVETGKLEEAGKLNDRAVSLTREANDRMSELPTLLVRGKIAARSGDLAGADKMLAEVASDPKSDASVKWEADNERAKLAEQQHQPAEANKHYLAAIATIEETRAKVQHEDFRLPFMANAAHLYDDYIRFLVQQGKVVDALRAANFSRARTLTEDLKLNGGFPASRVAFDPTLAARKQKAVVLFYWLGSKESYLWAITPHEVRLFALPAAGEIAARVERFRKVLAGPRDPLDAGDVAGRELYAVLLAPAKGLIPVGTRVIVVPDGSLATLNFETLVVPDPKPHYWIEDALVLNASALQLLTLQRATSIPHQRLLIIGDAVVPPGEYEPLANAEIEMERVRGHFSPQAEDVFAQGRASPAAYLANHPERYAYIHFVAHGTASQLTPLDSAVVLSKASAADDSFKLYAREIVKHPLRAELVTISACYGAGARTYSGEGLVGLSWAFLRAGAHHVIGALWEVSDASTPQLMDRMYDGLAQGKPPAEALRVAKLSLLHSENVFRKPFYWGPFQLYTGS